MKKLIYTLSLVFMGMGCGSMAQSNEANLSVEAFVEKQTEFSNSVILDVRTAEEWNSGIIPGAMLLDWYGADFTEKVNQLDKKVPVLLYCASGGRSAKALAKLSELGFEQVYHLQGGMGAWRASGGATVAPK